LKHTVIVGVHYFYLKLESKCVFWCCRLYRCFSSICLYHVSCD